MGSRFLVSHHLSALIEEAEDLRHALWHTYVQGTSDMAQVRFYLKKLKEDLEQIEELIDEPWQEVSECDGSCFGASAPCEGSCGKEKADS